MLARLRPLASSQAPRRSQRGWLRPVADRWRCAPRELAAQEPIAASRWAPRISPALATKLAASSRASTTTFMSLMRLVTSDVKLMLRSGHARRCCWWPRGSAHGLCPRRRPAPAGRRAIACSSMNLSRVWAPAGGAVVDEDGFGQFGRWRQAPDVPGADATGGLQACRNELPRWLRSPPHLHGPRRSACCQKGALVSWLLT